MTKLPLTQADLDDKGCGLPNCEHDHSTLFLHARCHIQKGTMVSYEKATGVLTIVCAHCGKVVAKILVAE